MKDLRSFWGKASPAAKTKTPEKTKEEKIEHPSLLKRPKRKLKTEESDAAAPKVSGTPAASDSGPKKVRVNLVDSSSDSDEFEARVAVKSETPKKKGTNRSPKATKAIKSPPASSSSSSTAAAKRPAPTAVDSSTPVKKSRTTKAAASPSKPDPEFPLKGVTFVVTGEFHNATKDSIKDDIMGLGGRMTTAVSGKTNYLIAGHKLEDGRSTEEGKKHITATAKGIQILDEDAYSEMIAKAQEKRSLVKGTGVTIADTKACSSSVPSDVGTSSPSTASGELWVDKYKPQTVQDLVGNKSNVDGLIQWLQTWEAIHLHKTRKPTITKNNMQGRATLLSGPPGIGKTSAATIVAKHLGYDIFELNASDARSKKIVGAVLGDAINSGSLVGKNTKRLVIMDEVDGMSSDDRGGIQELISIIKKSKVPIVCICNDRMKSSVRSLANYCFDLKFQRPRVEAVIARVAQVAAKEGFKVEENAVRELANAQQRDLRQVLGSIQMWSRSKSSLTYQDMAKNKGTVQKDEQFMLSNFDACRFMFNEASKPAQFNWRFQAYFIDYDLIPLMIQDNYVTACKMGNRDDSLERISQAADAVCDADVVSKSVRSKQNWTLLPQVAALNLRVTSLCNGSIGFPNFPQWLGKNSSRGKKRRLLGETAMHMRQKTMINAKTLRLDYLCTLREQMLRPLVQGDKDRLGDTISLMDNYGLDRDDVFEMMQEVRIEALGKNPFDTIPSQTKAAFTRLYNKTSHTSQALIEEAGIVGLKRKKAKALAAKESDGIDGEDGAEEGEEDDDEDAEMLALLASKGAKGKGKAKKTATRAKGKGKAKAK
mmetsp:Transcript_12922/g.23961  ORF Transcript_12922/g.23961 Transcript_12922/m.23961 type:complete len:823 (+) Transcript_12922:176-2644(+)